MFWGVIFFSCSDQSPCPCVILIHAQLTHIFSWYRSGEVRISVITQRVAETRPCWRTSGGPPSTRCRSVHTPRRVTAASALLPSSALFLMVRKNTVCFCRAKSASLFFFSLISLIHFHWEGFQILSSVFSSGTVSFYDFFFFPVSLYWVGVLVFSLLNIINSFHRLSFFLILFYKSTPTSLSWFLLFFALYLFCLSQDKTLLPSSYSLASLSLLGCCCLSCSSLWPPTAYGENGGTGKRQRRR